MNNKLLSICIPTYNRSEILEGTLNSLFSNPEFDEDKIEVIVSDNCSTDDTAKVVAKYPLVLYHRNDENIRDKNFAKVLGYAKGNYIRLFNDTLSFKEGMLKEMLEKIEKHREEDCNLFFYGNMFLHSNCRKEIHGKKNFLKTVSFYSTWIGNFGVWKTDFVRIINKDRYADLQFVQVDWSYKIVENNKTTIIYFEDFLTVTAPNKKGGYNVFETFINKYLYVIKREKFSLLINEIEKFRLFRYFVFKWLVKLFIEEKRSFGFDTSGVSKTILKKYWYEFYFYPIMLLFWLKKINHKQTLDSSKKHNT